MRSLLRSIYYAVPVSWRYPLRKVFYLPKDTLISLLGKREAMIPNQGQIFIGSGDFKEQGKNHLRILKQYTGIHPRSTVLDIGCGIGRTAAALTTFLSEDGKYQGFDVVKRGIDWCQENIVPEHPNFRFQYVPLHNDLYNTDKGRAEEFVFPYPDKAFDTAFLFSVFTHMQVEEIQNYLNEIDRVLQKGSVCLATFFCYSTDQEESIVTQKGFQFLVKKERHRLMSTKTKSANVALEYALIEKMTQSLEIKIEQYIEGYWKEWISKSRDNSFQDIIVFKKDSF